MLKEKIWAIFCLGQNSWCLVVFIPRDMPGGANAPLAPQIIPSEFRVQAGYLTPPASPFVILVLPQQAVHSFTPFCHNNSFQ